jgi:toxin YoeB
VKVVFSDDAWDDYLYWTNREPKIHARLNDLIEECRGAPFRGTGKPEPLRSDLQGFWSRRLTREDRLVYRVEGKGVEQRLEIAQCRQHY